MHDLETPSNDRRVREAQAVQVWAVSRALVEQSQKRLALSRALCTEPTYHAAPVDCREEPAALDAAAGEIS